MLEYICRYPVEKYSYNWLRDILCKELWKQLPEVLKIKTKSNAPWCKIALVLEI